MPMEKIKNFLKEFAESPDRRAEVLRFGLVGVFCTILQYTIYVVFLKFVLTKYIAAAPVVATMISYGISFIANFLLSSFFTFHSNPNAKRGLAFAASHLINLGLQTGLVAIFKELMNPTFALLPALVICVPTNYFLVRFALKDKKFS